MASSFNATVGGHAMLFPCATGVQVPHIGAEDSKVKIATGKQMMSPLLPMTIIPQDSNPVNSKYVQMVSAGLSFTEDVVEDRCLHMMPYSDKYFADVFEPGRLVTLPKRSTSSIGRHNRRGTDARHMPCYLKKIAKPSPLTPLRKEAKEKALQLHKQALLASQEERRSKSVDGISSPSPSSFFMTEISTQDGQASVSQLKPIPEKKGEIILPEKRQTLIPKSGTCKDSSVAFKTKDDMISKGSGITGGGEDKNGESKPPKNDWDDHLMSRLSQLTANWIVHERMGADKQKDKLSKTLESWYGRPTHTDLVREEMSDGDEEEKKKDQKPKKKWQKKEASLLSRVYNVTPPPAEALDPYSDDNKAPFYRQPAGIRRKKRSEEKEEAADRKSKNDGIAEKSSINATAHNIYVRGYVETPRQTLKDFLSPRIGDKVYDTENLYQQEWLTGNKHVYKPGRDPNEIHMDTKNKFRKNLQREMPQKPETWYTLEDDKKQDKKDHQSDLPTHRPERGQKRWTGLPEPVNELEGMMNAVPTGFDSVVLRSVDPKQRRKANQNHALVTIVHDWRSKWFLSGQFADSTPDDLIHDMADIQPHVRLKAISTVAKATEYKPPLDNSVLLDSSEYDPINELPEQIFVALECLLDDSHEQVRKAAAVTLYALDRPAEKAKVRLREMLDSESSVDRWAAAQCLAHYGDCDSDVVAEIIKQILSTETAVKYEQGIHLLAIISNSSTLVHCMVAEQLNSSSWRHRVIACKILPTLFGSINRDITQKLSELMWHDWHNEVRKAAAQCLGKTSHGRDVHDDIRDRILHGAERTKLEAINKLGQLGIMTAKLLPAFLECFADPYVSIRCEVCITCGNLQIKEEQVLDRLVHLATFDPIWKVKALAIQALGKIKEVNDEIKECLLWAMRYEEQPGVRAEACHSLIALDIQDDDVIDALQERLLVESSQIVREEMIEALSIFGLSTSEDMDMVAQIKCEVRKLCHRNIIASQIIVNETDEAKRAQLKRMVCQTEKDIEALNEKKAGLLKRIRSQAHSVDSLGSSPQPRTSTPLPKVKVTSESTTPEPISRENTVFTPSADKELEAILNQEEVESASDSAGGKSRPVTGTSQVMAKEEEEEEDLQSKIVVTHVGDEEEEAYAVADGDIPDGDAQDDDGKVHAPQEVGIVEIERDEGTQKQAEVVHPMDQLNIPVPLPRSYSQQGMLSPTASVVDMKGSRLSLAQFSDRRSIMSRDSLREREKLNQEVSAIYSDLDARYADMIEDLIKIDRGLNTKGSSADSSSNSTMTIMTTEEIQAATAQIQAILAKNETTQAVPGGESGPVEMTMAGATEYGTENMELPASDETDPTQQKQEQTVDGEQEKEGEEKEEGEWKSFVDTLSRDDAESIGGSTSYPSFDENDDNNAARSGISTGLTGQASEYENDSVRLDDENDQDVIVLQEIVP